jgi:hypothetical protein
MCIWRTTKYAQPKITPSSPNASGTASATMSICRHRREHREPRQVLVGVDLVREPGVGAPRPPQGGEHQHAAAEPLPRGVVRHQGRDLREREDEHEVEEELERDDAFLAAGGHGASVSQHLDGGALGGISLAAKA